METVIVLDKIPLIRRAIGSLLHALNLKVVAETDCVRQVLSMAKEFNPCLIILDAELCTQDGFYLIKKLRACSKRVRLLILADTERDVLALQCVRAGACAYIPKSISLDSLQSVIQNICNGYVVFPRAVLETIAYDGDSFKRDSSLPPVNLSKRELVVLKYLYAGHSNKKIAEVLGLNPRTISTYKLRILTKLGLNSVVDIATLAGLDVYLALADQAYFCKSHVQSIQQSLQF